MRGTNIMKDVINPYTAISIEITRDELRAIDKVVEYLWDDEGKDAQHYRGALADDHIFVSVKMLDELKRRVAYTFDQFTQVG